MNRRALLASVAGSGIGLTAGCLGRLPVVGSSVDTTFELVETEFDATARPDVRVDDDTVTARGTVEYGSSECGGRVGTRRLRGLTGAAGSARRRCRRLERSHQLLRRSRRDRLSRRGDTYSTTRSGLDQ
ncbi:hypothetical protein [Natronorubrum thiooxidans]|uniref:hypothetical protein n=1 Tax=Natronorubrum thiooxidans TaxID=308853 RepID=UPI001F3102A7|nr:hypothetical protein [Natronorubrum thiooxidans]